MESDYKFEYMLLSRLQMDCEFYLGYGNRCDKFLWAKNVSDQISKMRELYNMLPVKPMWIDREDINNYEIRMNCTKGDKE